MDAIRLSIGVCLMLAGLAWGVLCALDGEEDIDMPVVALLFAGAILIAGGDA